MPAWNELLRKEREASGLSRRALAELSGVSEDTIASYEYGRRAPRRDTILKLTRAMNLDGAATNAILEDAGLDLEISPWLRRAALRHRPLSELTVEIASYPWPALALNERFEIVAWNALANAVAELDFGRDLPEPSQRNLLRIAAMPHFRERVLNWEQVVAVMVGMYKGHHMGSEELGEGSPYFQAIVDDIARQDAAAPPQDQVMPRLLSLWLETPPRAPSSRITWPVRWRASDGTKLAFNCLITTWDDFDAVSANDWNPADAQTWAWLESRP